MQGSGNCSAGAGPWYDMRWGLRRNRIAGLTGPRGLKRALLETRLMVIIVGTILCPSKEDDDGRVPSDVADSISVPVGVARSDG